MERETPDAEARDEIGPETIQACAMVGSDWAQTSVAHVDRRGAVYVIDSKWARIPVRHGCTPSLEQIARALARCWESLGVRREDDFCRFLLCLPPWCTRYREACATVNVFHDERIPYFRVPVVRQDDVARVARKASADRVPPGYVTVDLFPRFFALASGRTVVDPREETSRTLRLRAGSVIAELGTVKGILDILHRMGVKVDAICSTPAASAGSLEEGEMETVTGVVDVGRRHTSLAVFDEGDLCHCATLEGGSEQVLMKTAQRLGTTKKRLSSLMAEPELDEYSGDPNDRYADLPLFGFGRCHPLVHHIEPAASESVEVLFERIDRGLQTAASLRSVDVRRVVFLGDAPLIVRLLKQLTSERRRRPCRIHIPDNVYLKAEMKLRGHVRTISLVQKHDGARGRFQYFLEDYNESILDMLSRLIRDGAAGLSWRAAKTIANVVPVSRRDGARRAAGRSPGQRAGGRSRAYELPGGEKRGRRRRGVRWHFHPVFPTNLLI
ncbi:hypothetical protein ACFLSJ_03915 [Verrucomicrobiota bacterium]